eukprot:SAG31_NODE_1540_length_7954_cov_3.521961_8_plen_83_part_00
MPAQKRARVGGASPGLKVGDAVRLRDGGGQQDGCLSGSEAGRLVEVASDPECEEPLKVEAPGGETAWCGTVQPSIYIYIVPE